MFKMNEKLKNGTEMSDIYRQNWNIYRENGFGGREILREISEFDLT